MSEEPIKIPTWFWVIMSICLVWNILGLMAFFNQMFMSAEAIAELSDAEQKLYNNIPLWADTAFAFAVIGGTLGCLLTLVKKALAQIVFILSLIGILVQMYYSFFIANSIEIYGPGSVIMPSLVIVVGIFLVWLSRHAISKQWLT
jgi:hypothetical protein